MDDVTDDCKVVLCPRTRRLLAGLSVQVPDEPPLPIADARYRKAVRDAAKAGKKWVRVK